MAAWCLATGVCLHWLFAHAYAPAETGPTARSWPAGSRLPRSAAGPSLLMFAHPCCPCTRASIRELAELARQFPPGTQATIVFVTRGLSDSDLDQGESLRAASRHGLAEFYDDGREADLFGARVSGEVLAFDASGRRIFQGGLTPARGHAADASRRERFLQLVSSRASGPETAPVYGCPLPR